MDGCELNIDFCQTFCQGQGTCSPAELDSSFYLLLGQLPTSPKPCSFASFTRLYSSLRQSLLPSPAPACSCLAPVLMLYSFIRIQVPGMQSRREGPGPSYHPCFSRLSRPTPWPLPVCTLHTLSHHLLPLPEVIFCVLGVGMGAARRNLI